MNAQTQHTDNVYYRHAKQPMQAYVPYSAPNARSYAPPMAAADNSMLPVSITGLVVSFMFGLPIGLFTGPLGRRAVLHSGVVIGADGFGFARDEDASWVKIPQTGRVVIGDDVEIGANTTIDRGALDDTVIGDGVKLDNQIQIAHNVRIGDKTIMAACSGVAGSTVIGARCMIGGQAGISGHLTIVDDVVVSAWTLVAKSIDKPGVYTATLPLQTHSDWIRNFAHLRRLDALADRIRALEQGQIKGEPAS
jgi:UDP-3-O-[3-hydroxymyristoyl] glucosamine N-acyltransferase